MRRLYRSQRDKKIFGLCGGLAEQLNVDATLLRLVMVAAAFFSGGAVIFLYVVASLVIPKEAFGPYAGGVHPGAGGNYGGTYPGGGVYGGSRHHGRSGGSRADGSMGMGGTGSYAEGPMGMGGGIGGYADGFKGTSGGYPSGHSVPGGAYGQQPQDPAGSNLDEIMKDLERKSMEKEIEALKAKLAQYEKQEKGEE